MSDAKTSDPNERWRALWSDLGIDPEPQPAPVEPVAKTPPKPVIEAKPLAEAVPPPSSEDAAQLPAEAVAPAEGKPPAPRGRRPRSSPPPEETIELPPAEPADEANAILAEAESVRLVEEPEAPPAERPRRGRGRSGKKKEQAARPRTARAERVDEAAEDKKAARSRRGRGRSGKGRPGEEAAQVIEPVADVEPDADEDEDVMSGLSDWKVPSWNELIASLYRPER